MPDKQEIHQGTVKGENLSIRGFNRLDTSHMGVPSYVVGTLTFTLTPDNDYFEFWAGGNKFIKTSSESVVFPNATGTYYFYFDTNGVLQYILHTEMTEDIFLTSAICGLCYYDAVDDILWGAKDEQHGIIMDGSTHFNKHLTKGFTWARMGGEITGLVDGASTYTDISTGLHFDEDIINISPTSTVHPFMYREGTDGEWKITAEDNSVGHIVSGDTYASWNEYTGATWQLTESTNSTDYIIYFFIKTNFATSPYRKIVGQTTYSSRNNARDGLLNDLKAIQLAGLPSTECEFQFAYICTRDGEVEDDGNGNGYVDLRGVQIRSLA